MKVSHALSLFTLALAAEGVPTPKHKSRRKPKTKVSATEQEVKIKTRKGLKLFVIDGKEIWALNEANARRKLL